jgi:isopentenyldiphosphate isomerase
VRRVPPPSEPTPPGPAAGDGAVSPFRPEPRDELVDVVDEHDRVLRVVTRAEMRRERLRHRCTFVVVRSSDASVLIHRRSDLKDMWPGRWDLSCGGVVGSGEAWEDAAARELAEELGISGVELVELTRGAYVDADVDEVARAWQVVHDGPFTFTDDEVVEAVFVTVAQLRLRIRDDSFVPDSLALLGHLIR